ncbi:hypothetical protein [Eubacterium pyruvativorans]|uniref:hypothetical protein n=1 Tax=Eubacterium pyruvativorans TaxID=155865 RepID=UPI00156374A1|nr:hypothetical protein [Eubacterium pyruvativorans]
MKREELYDDLVRLLVRYGYPEEFGRAIATQLGTEKTMMRMLRYLRAARPVSAEEIADEMLAICADREMWQRKKASEYYSAKYYQMRYEGFGVPEDDPEE